MLKKEINENLKDLQIDLLKTNSLLVKDISRQLNDHFKSDKALDVRNTIWVKEFLQIGNKSKEETFTKNLEIDSNVIKKT